MRTPKLPEVDYSEIKPLGILATIGGIGVLLAYLLRRKK